MVVWSLLAAGLLGVVHLLAPKLRFLHGIPRSRWLSMASGASVAYVFVHLLPELEKGHAVLREQLQLDFYEHPSYLVALGGLAIFYGLERYVQTAPDERSPDRAGQTGENDDVFWIHIGSFAVYNVLIGYLLLHRSETELWTLFFFTLAMAFHFLVNDYGLSEHHKEAYRHRGRWIIIGAILIGWLIGVFVRLPELVISFLMAFLAGGVILNVLKEELPEERQSRFWAFAVGAVAYTLLLLAV